MGRSDRITKALDRDERLHIGFDFAFGLTRGAGQALLGKPGWEGYWSFLHDTVEDAQNNRSNRFAVGELMNRATPTEGPFWGHPWQHTYTYLSPTRCAKGTTAWPHPFPAKRICDARVPGAQEIWKLAYTGSVGSQMLLGIAALERLRRRFPEVAIWPFETGFADDLSKPILVTEIYPSAKLFDFKSLLGNADVADEAQVMAVSRTCHDFDHDGNFADLLYAKGLSPSERAVVISEEGWILGQ